MAYGILKDLFATIFNLVAWLRLKSNTIMVLDPAPPPPGTLSKDSRLSNKVVKFLM